jgi:hypothetical protein
LPEVPGTENVMSRRPSELRDVPPSIGDVEFGRVHHFFELGHPVFFLAKNCPLHVSYSFGCVARSRLHNKPTGKSIKTMISVDICCWRQTHWGGTGRRPIPKYYGRSHKEWRILVS